MNFSCFALSRTTQASASLKPDERFGFDLQYQLHPRAGASLQFPEGTAPRGPARPTPGAPGPSLTPPTPIKPRRFYGSVEIDINRPVKAFDTILNSVVMELQETATGHARGCQDCGGQRFESPPLHQVVRTSGHDFLDHRISRHSRGLRRHQSVC